MVPGTQKRWLCEKCDKTFTYSSNLLRHQRTLHEENNIEFHHNVLRITPSVYFECHHCHLRIKRKDYLRKHLMKCPVPLEPLPSYMCSHCHRLFTRKDSLGVHIDRFHVRPPDTSVGGFRCLLCPDRFVRKCHIDAHYQDHGILPEWQDLQFESEAHFESWKMDIETKTVTKFRLRHSKRNSKRTTHSFICHRSGLVVAKGSYPRRRAPKAYGSKKLGGHCPAEMIVTVEDGGYRVKYQMRHVGHEISTKKELIYKSLEKWEKEWIASNLLNGASRSEVLRKKTTHELPDSAPSRLSLITYHDVYNAGLKCGVERYTSSCLESDSLSVQSWIEENSEIILFCKTQGTKHETYKNLQLMDFVLVLMGSSQAEQLKAHGERVVCFDGTHRMTQYQFILYTLLVLDANRQGTPVGFLVSNRNDSLMMDIFIECVHDRVGKIATKCLLSDMPTTFYDSWSKLMGEPEVFLYCSWHVSDSWRRQYIQIEDKIKRLTLRKELQSLLTESDQALFERKLEDFVRQTDEHLMEFLCYFCSNFLDQKRLWAHCYRKVRGSSTNNSRLKSFYKTLKRFIAGWKRIVNLFEGLKYLEQYLYSTECIKEICSLPEGTIHTKTLSIRNHKTAVDFFNEYCGGNNIEIIQRDDRTWEVPFLGGIDNEVLEIHIVEKIDEVCCSIEDECQLVCQDCNACFHQYRCSCSSSCIKSIMCEHIHLLCLHRNSLESCDMTSVPYFCEVLTDGTIEEQFYDERAVPEDTENCPIEDFS